MKPAKELAIDVLGVVLIGMGIFAFFDITYFNLTSFIGYDPLVGRGLAVAIFLVGAALALSEPIMARLRDDDTERTETSERIGDAREDADDESVVVSRSLVDGTTEISVDNPQDGELEDVQFVVRSPAGADVSLDETEPGEAADTYVLADPVVAGETTSVPVEVDVDDSVDVTDDDIEIVVLNDDTEVATERVPIADVV
ncbi:hypothetical protein [Halorarius halobius]|uniref:hypothetical protein n=1 Tax=Halorarius halobius TaxID=2962671 RepID=UPI0020CCF3C6|nr:hypothetical protein [Halorarius halobius]